MPTKLSLLSLLLLLCCAGSALALGASAAGPASAAVTFAPAEEELEDEAETSEDEEFELEECVEDEEEECVEEEESDGSSAPGECLLTNAEATVFAASGRDQVKLQLRYRTSSPTEVAVAYGLRGDKGALYLGDEKKRVGKKGVLRLSRSLTEDQMAKVMAAKDFTVRIRVPEAPGHCRPLFDQHLDLRRATPAGFSWQQSE